MAEETEVAQREAAPKKGNSKLMIIVVAVIMLVTGGFVGLKMKAGGAKDAKKGFKIELGTEADSILEVHEFLVNLSGSQDGGKFLRTDISVQTAKGFDKTALTTYLAPVEDAINAVLSKYSSEEIQQPGFKERLKKQIAAAANDAMAEADPKMKKELEEKEKLEGLPTHHPEWDSDTGPILKVYYTSFAFQ